MDETGCLYMNPKSIHDMVTSILIEPPIHWRLDLLAFNVLSTCPIVLIAPHGCCYFTAPKVRFTWKMVH